MALFTVRDRIAAGIICIAIAAGWGVRLGMRRTGTPPDTGTVSIIRGAVPVPGSLRISETAGDTIDINSADAALLEALPMVGPTRARAIVAYRISHGPFAAPEDIMRVSGIGPGIFAAVRDRIIARADSSSAGGN